MRDTYTRHKHHLQFLCMRLLTVLLLSNDVTNMLARKNTEHSKIYCLVQLTNHVTQLCFIHFLHTTPCPHGMHSPRMRVSNRIALLATAPYSHAPTPNLATLNFEGRVEESLTSFWSRKHASSCLALLHSAIMRFLLLFILFSKLLLKGKVI